MKIVKDYPPLMDLIAGTFGVELYDKLVVFSWGDTIYNPHGLPLALEIIAHEEAHGARQLDPEKWWKQYLEDVEFRLAEEVIGHKAEYKKVCSLVKDRNLKARYLHGIALKLSSSLYGNLISQPAALKLLKS